MISSYWRKPTRLYRTGRPYRKIMKSALARIAGMVQTFPAKRRIAIQTVFLHPHMMKATRMVLPARLRLQRASGNR